MIFWEEAREERWGRVTGLREKVSVWTIKRGSNRKLLTPPFIAFLIEVDAFHDTITLAIRVLISGLEGKYESAVKAMLTLNWAACEGVGEESAYVRVRREGGTERERKGGKRRMKTRGAGRLACHVHGWMW